MTSVTPVTPVTRVTSAKRRSLQPRFAPYLFVAPAVLLAAAFLAAPLIYTLWLSFQGRRVSGSGLGIAQQVFVGFDNYLRTFSDGALFAGFGRMLLYAVIAVPLTLGLALLFALLLDNASTRFGRFTRIAIFIPYAVPGVIAALMDGEGDRRSQPGHRLRDL